MGIWVKNEVEQEISAQSEEAPIMPQRSTLNSLNEANPHATAYQMVFIKIMDSYYKQLLLDTLPNLCHKMFVKEFFSSSPSWWLPFQ